MSGFATAGGTTIKSIQRGTVSVAYNQSSAVTINSIDTDKTVVNTSCANGYQINEYYGTHGFSVALMTNGVLTNSTTLTCSTGTLLITSFVGAASPVLSWEVIEYA